MHLTEEELKQIVKEEFINLINEEEIDEKLFNALKNFGKGLFRKVKRSFSDMPDPGASGGVGKWYATYKEPQKEPEEEKPEDKPDTSMVRAKPQGVVAQPQQTIEPDEIDAYDARARVRPAGLLGPGQQPSQQEFTPFGLLPLTRQQRQQLLLSEPTKIGVTDKVGDLLSDTQSEAFNLLFQEKSRAFKRSDYFERLTGEQKAKTDSYINTVLKSLIDTDRVLKNPTYTVVSEEEVPSVRQIETDIFDSYVVKSLKHSTKQVLNYIPPIIIDFVIDALHEEGRLAISRRMYNKLKHTDDPRLKLLKPSIQESKSYNSFYNNWKKYTKTGVKI